MNKITLLLFLTTVLARGQSLHHQELSSQGKSTITNKGYYVSQTIGQTIATESFNNSNIIMQQGFEMSMWSKLSKEFNNSDSKLITKIYPNPFTSTINISFMFEIKKEVEVTLFDVLGKIVFYRKISPEQNNIIITGFETFPKGNYFLTLQSETYKYANQLIKI